jgi:zinc protease
MKQFFVTTILTMSAALSSFAQVQPLATSSATASASATSASSATLAFVQQLGDVREYRLPNGLQVLLAHDDSKPQMSVNITYRVGSRHEGLGEKGSAHLLEHMLFKPSGAGNPPRYQDAKKEMQALGMRWNGTTSTDRTNYFAHYFTGDDKAAERTQYMLGWLATMMTQARFTADDLKSEMTVVRNEFERGDNEPTGILAQRMMAAAFANHGYAHPTIGTRSDIETVPVESLYAFYRQHYRPDNATLIVTGKFDADAVKVLIEREFGSIAAPALALPDRPVALPPQEGEQNIVMRRAGGLPSAMVLYRMPQAATRQAHAARLLASTLQQEGGPMERGLLATQMGSVAWAYFRPSREPGHLMAGLGLPEPAAQISGDAFEIQVVSAQAALARVIESYQPTDEEVETARASALARIRATLRDSESLAQSLSEAVAQGDWRLLLLQRDLLTQIKADEVRQTAREYLVPSNRTSGSYIPFEASAPSAATQTVALPHQRAPQTPPLLKPQFDNFIATHLIANYAINTGARGQKEPKNTSPVITAAPQFDITASALAQRVQTTRLSVGGKPGLQLAVLPRAAKDDRVTGSLQLRWGTADSVRGSAMLANLIAPMLDEGTWVDGKINNALVIKQRLQALDARISFSSSTGALGAWLEFPASNTAAVMQLLDEMLRKAAFDSVAFERTLRASLAQLQSGRSSTGAVAANNLALSTRTLYPEGDPREVRSLEQSEKLLRAATVQAVRAHWQKFGSAQVGEFVLSGPVDKAALQAQLQQLWGNWTSAEPHQPWVSQFDAEAERKAPVFASLRVDGKANASYAAQIGFAMHQRHPDYPALAIATQLLSRQSLWQRVREKEGLSYGVGASLSAPWEGDAGGISISASFAPENLPRLREAVRSELQTTVNKGFDTAQIDSAIQTMLSNRQQWLSQAANAVTHIAFNLRHQRPMDSYDQFTQAFKQLQPAQVNLVLQKYLRIDDLREVAAGSFTQAPQ